MMPCARKISLRLVVLIGATACLPFPTQSPHVDRGIGVGYVVGARVVQQDTSLRSTSVDLETPVPEVGVSVSAGFRREDGKGPAVRGTGVFGFRRGVDLYLEMPRVRNIVAGVGATVLSDSVRRWTTSPYAMVGWDLSDQQTLYVAQSLLELPTVSLPHRTTTASVTVVGWEESDRAQHGDGTRVNRTRFFAAFYRHDQDLERVPFPLVLPKSAPVHSLLVVGVSANITVLWHRDASDRVAPRVF